MFSSRRRNKKTSRGSRNGLANPQLGLEFLEQRTLFASISGFVYHDANYDDAMSVGENGLAGVRVTLTGYEKGSNRPVSMTATTGTSGAYQFNDLKKGTYAISANQPPGFVDGNERAGSAGGKVQNDLISSIEVDKNNDSYSGYLFGEISPSTLRGFSYVDVDRDGNYDEGDRPLGGVIVKLAGMDDRGTIVERNLSTGADGSYNFGSLRPGKYLITAATPSGYTDGRETLGRFDENSHSIASNGRVLNDQFVDIVLGVGQAGRNYNFGEFEMQAAHGVLADAFQDKIIVDGTSGDDVFEFIAGTSEHTLILNGQARQISAEFNIQIFFYGRGGNNVAKLTGGAGVDQAELRATSAKLTGVSYQVLVYTTTSTTVQSGGGEDRALFYDSTGDDTFYADPLGATLAGANYEHAANDFHRVYAYATTGNDAAQLVGSDADDRFTATPTDARMDGVGYYNYARGFDIVQGDARDGGDDRAYLYGSTGTDYLRTQGNDGRLYGAAFDNSAHGFDRLYGYGAGGTDVAYFDDTSDSDYYRVDDDGARMYANGYYNRAIDFDYHYVLFNPSDGKTDKVAIYDSAADDILLAVGNQVLAYRGATVHRILNPDLVEAYADLGNDRYYASGVNFELRLLGDWNPYYASLKYDDLATK